MPRGDRPLPGLAPQLGDPGVFICGPEDVAPWESIGADAQPGRRRRDPAARRQPRTAPAAPAATWLVLRICLSCDAESQTYCERHGADNWWFVETNLGRGKRHRSSGEGTESSAVTT